MPSRAALRRGGVANPPVLASQSETPVLVVGVADYPHGLAAPFRMRMIAKSFIVAGFRAEILVPYAPGVGPSERNRQSHGVVEGVPFSYVIPPRFVPKAAATILACKVVGTVGIMLRIILMRLSGDRPTIVSYGGTGVGDTVLWLTSRATGGRLILEFCDEASVALGGTRREAGLRERVKFATHRLRERWVARRADALLVITSALTKHLNARSDERVYLLPILADLSEIDHDPARASATGRRPTFCWIGNFRRFEGLENLIEAASTLGARRSDYSVELIGLTEKHAQYGATLRKKIRHLALEDRVFIRPSVPRDELRQRLLEATALLLPREDHAVNRTNLPTKLIDYLASGRPVVMTPVGETQRIFRGDHNAIVSRSASAEDLAQAMEWALEHPDEATRIGAAGQELGRRLFDYRSHALGLRALMDRIWQAGNEAQSEKGDLT